MPDDNITTEHFEILKLLDLELPEACKAGIRTNLEILRIHARKVEAFCIPESESSEGCDS